MTVHRAIYLTCDVCNDYFPSRGIHPAPLDHAIFSIQDIRREAFDAGWMQIANGDGNIFDRCDYCTRHRRSLRRKAKA